jgi:histidinol-phosphate aminotransferase
MSAQALDLQSTYEGRLLVGMGVRRGVGMEHLREALADCLESCGARTRDIAAIVTIEGKQAEPALQELADLLSVPLAAVPADRLATQSVPNPSPVAERTVGTPSVAEAAVLAMGADLVAPKHIGKGVTVALGLLPEPAEPEPAPADPWAGRPIVATHPATTEIDLRLLHASVDLGHHGDQDTAPGLVNLSVNVRPDGPPDWLRNALRHAMDDLTDYPDQSRAIAAVAARHMRPPEQVLLTAGAAEAFVLLARTLAPRRAVVVHPQFTEPEAALVAAGHEVHRAILEPPFRLADAEIPNEADLVVVGNPTNPTALLHSAEDVLALAKPGRILVVDEAFMDTVPGEPGSLAGGPGGPPLHVPGLVVIRSLTKTWGLAGLRVGYVLGDPDVLSVLASAQALWAVSTPALVAAEACSSPGAVREAEDRARRMVAEREYLVQQLRRVPELQVVEGGRASFVLFLVRGQVGLDVHRRMRRAGWAVRRADTFPGLGPGWLRVAVRDRATTDAFVQALASTVAGALPR